MKPRNTVLALFQIVMLALPFEALAGGYAVSGRIVDKSNVPLENPSTIFSFEIMNSTGACVLYREQQALDMTNSDGRFSVTLGNGTVQFPAAPYPVSKVISNSGTLNCEGGSTYTPFAGDTRILRIKFNDGAAWETFSPDQTLRAVPYASEASNSQTVGEVPVTQLLRTSDGSTIPALPAASVSNLMSLISGNSTSYVKSETDPTVMSFAKSALPTCTNGQVLSANGSTLSCITATGGGGSTGVAGGDLAGNYPNPTVNKIQNIPVNFSGLSPGQILKYNGSQWTSSGITASDVTDLPATLSGYITHSSVTSASCTSNQSMYWNSVSGNFLCQNIVMDSIRGKPVSSATPITGQVLTFDGTQWSPASYLSSLTGDVTSTAPSSNATVNSVGGVSASMIATGVNDAIAANSANVVSSIVKRDPSGNFSAGTITANLSGNATSATTAVNATTATNFTGSLGGDVTGTQTATTVARIQGIPLAATGPTDGDMLIYSASTNQWTLKKPQTCDSTNGWNKVPRGFPYCVKKVDATAVNFPQQVSKCANAGAVLCSYEQVFNACIFGAMPAADATWSSNFNGTSSVAVLCNGATAAFSAVSYDQTGAIISSTSASFISYCCKPVQ